MLMLYIAVISSIMHCTTNYRRQHQSLSSLGATAFTASTYIHRRFRRLDLPSGHDLNNRRTHTAGISPLLLSATSTPIPAAFTNNTERIENSTFPLTDYSDHDDPPSPVDNINTLQVDRSNMDHISTSTHDFQQILTHHLNSIQQDMSSNEIIRTAMTIETLWKQRCNVVDGTADNINGAATAESTVDDDSDVVSSFNIVLKAWCKTCQILLEFHDQNGVTSYNTSPNKPPVAFDKFVIPDIHVDVGSIQIYTAKDAAMHATRLLSEQLSSTTSSTHTLKPNRTSFHIVMEAWSKSHDMDAPEQVQQLIQLMEKKYKIHPDTVTYNLYIETIAHGKVGSTSSYNDRIERINEILNELDRCPTATSNAQTINSVLHAYSTTIGKYVTQLNYNNVDSSKKQTYEDEIEKLLKSVMQIFNDLKRKYEQTKNNYNQPDMSTYTAVMECFARHGTIQSTEQVEALLREMKEMNRNANNKRFVKPSVYTYTTVIKAWSRTYHPNAPARAEELLKECIDMYQNGENQRNNGYYNNHHNKLTSVVFTSVIQCWSRSQEPTKAVQVLQLLQQMRTMAKDTPLVNPTLLTYNTAIDACTKTRGTPAQQTAALKIAFAIYKTMEITNHIVPNHITYGTLLKAISSLVPLGDETRNTLSKAVFEKATKASQVDRNVIQQLQKSCDTSVLQTLLLSSSDPNNSMIQTNNNGHIDYEKVPIQWSKNVRTP